VATAGLIVWSDEGVDAQLRNAFERAVEQLPRRVQDMEQVAYEDRRCLLRLWAAPHARAEHVMRLDEPSVFLAFVGNPVIAGETPESWDTLLQDCVARGADALTRVWPPFAAFLRDERRDSLAVVADRSALHHVYVREGPRGSRWASTSAFALASLGPELDLAGAMEWATAGHFLTGRTFFRGIRQLGCGEVVEFRPGATVDRPRWIPRAGRESRPGDYEREVLDAVDVYGSRPDGLFFELTGGLDSRLLLAARLRSGNGARTWTVGRPDDVEMRTIQRLRRVAAFEHLLVSPDAGFAARVPELVGEMHSLADGEANALIYTSLLVAFEGLADVRRTSMTGSGGELARAFYWRAIAGRRAPHVRGVSVDLLLRKVMRDSGRVRFAFRSDLPDPQAAIRETVVDFIGRSTFQNPHEILDDFYLRTRMRRFAGRNISTTGLFCAQGVPYFAHPVVDAALSLPASEKRDGRVVREAIVQLSPALASVPLGSGDTVPPPSLAHPTRGARRVAGLGRKAMARYGGRFGRTVSRSAVESMPWSDVVADPRFREYVRDLLLAGDARCLELFDRTRLTALVESSLATGAVSPLGLVLTMELTLRRFDLTL